MKCSTNEHICFFSLKRKYAPKAKEKKNIKKQVLIVVYNRYVKNLK